MIRIRAGNASAGTRRSIRRPRVCTSSRSATGRRRSPSPMRRRPPLRWPFPSSGSIACATSSRRDGLCRQEMISSIANTGYALWRPSPSLIRDPKSQAESPNIIYEVSELPPRPLSERGPSAWAHPLEEGAIGFAVFDHGVYCARHLGRDRGVCLAAQMRVLPVLGDVALGLVAEAVGPLQHCGLAELRWKRSASGKYSGR